MHPVSIIFFDLDGTLADTLEDIAASVNHVLSVLGRPSLPAETIRQYIGSGIENLLERSLGGRDARIGEAVARYKEHHRLHLFDRTSLYPGAREALEGFSAVPLVVVSNKSSEFVLPLLERLGIASLISSVIGANSGFPLKPAPDAILHTLAERGIPRDRALIVGDGATDIHAGKAAGIMTCAVTYGYRSEEELRSAGPDHIIHGLLELVTLFRPETDRRP